MSGSRPLSAKECNDFARLHRSIMCSCVPSELDAIEEKFLAMEAIYKPPEDTSWDDLRYGIGQAYSQAKGKLESVQAYKKLKNDLVAKLDSIQTMQTMLEDYERHLEEDSQSNPKLKQDSTYKAKILAINELSRFISGFQDLDRSELLKLKIDGGRADPYGVCNVVIGNNCIIRIDDWNFQHLDNGTMLRLDDRITRALDNFQYKLKSSLPLPEDLKKTMPDIFKKSLADIIGSRRYRFNAKDIGSTILKGLVALIANFTIVIPALVKWKTKKHIHEHLNLFGSPVTGKEVVKNLKDVASNPLVSHEKRHRK